MLKSLMIFALLILSVAISCKEKIDINKEKESIKAVIEEELDAFIEQDFNRVKSTWVWDSLSRKIFMHEGNYLEIKGGEELRKLEEWNLHGEWRTDSTGLGVLYSNYEIIVYDNSALVFHEVKSKSGELGTELEIPQKRIVHLVKANGIWKQDLLTIYYPEKILDLEETIRKYSE